MNPSPYRSADDRFPYLKHISLPNGFEFEFLMVSERSENWYGNGETHDDYMSLIEPGDTVIDCGANEGYTAILAAIKAGQTGRVLAFEPAPHNIAPVNLNLRLNHLRERVAVFAAAAGDRSGQLGFAGESAVPGQDGVIVHALDDMPLLREQPLHVIKIDVEGYEMRVLRGASKLIARYRPRILVELHLHGPDGPDMREYGDEPQDILDFAEAHNYSGVADLPLRSGVVILKPNAQ